jgi:metal-responsive CopG/Arc/MetJ family transcriptional regulator
MDAYLRFVRGVKMFDRISISLPKDVADSANRMAAEMNVSRSKLFTQLVQAEQKRIMEKELARGYQALAEEHRRFAEMAVGLASEVLPSYEHGSPPGG